MEEDEQVHNCEICGEIFTSKNTLQKHEISHSEERPFKCNLCDKSFTRKDKCNDHISTHFEESKFECQLCDKTFSRKDTLDKHQFLHLDIKVFSCKICKKSFSTSFHLERHKIIHSEEKPYSCDECEKSFARLDSFNKHKCLRQETQLNFCHTCSKSFSRKDHLRRHKRNVHGEVGPTSFSCNVCDASFSTADALYEHSLVEPDLKCDICSKLLCGEDGLERHKRIHLSSQTDKKENLNEEETKNIDLLLEDSDSNNSEFSCDTCEKSFANNLGLMRHRSYYCKEKPHGCDVCKKTFTNIENLKQHKFVHMDKKLKFQCHICKKYFSRNEHLKRHQRNVHGVTTNSGIFCELCDESFTSAIALHNHNINQHNVKCEECGKVFSSEAAMKRHKRSHINSGNMNYEISSQRTSKLKKSKESYSDMEDSESDDSDLNLSYKNEAYNCEICNKSFTLQFSLDRHIKVKHNNKDGSKNNEMYYYSADEGDVLPENSRIPEDNNDEDYSPDEIPSSDEETVAVPAKTITLSCDICNETYTDSDIYIIHVWSHCPYDVEVLLKNCNKDKTIEDSKKNIELSSTIICKKDVVKENTISGDSIENESVKIKIDKDGIKNEFDGVTDKDDTAEHISSKSIKNSFVIKEVHGDKNKSVNNENYDKTSYQYARVIVENVHKNITRNEDQNADSSKHSEDGLDENNVMDNTTKLVEIEESDSNDDFGDNCFDVETQKDDNINESNEKSPEIGQSETASIDPQSSLDWNKAFLNYVQTSEVVDSDGESIEEANDDTINDEIEDSEDDIEAAIKPMKIIPVKNIEKENQNGKKGVNEIVERDDHLKTYTENSTALNNAIDKENPEEKVKNQVDIPEGDKVIVSATGDERQMHNHETTDKAKENNDIKYGFDKKVNVLQVNAKDVTNKDKFACKTVKVMLKRYSLDALNMMAEIMNKRNNTEEKNIGYEMEVKTTFDNIDLNYDCEIVSDNQNAPPEEVKEVEVSSVHHVANSAEKSCNELEETGEFIEVSYRTSVRNLEEIKDNESFIENNVVNEDNTVKDIIDEESSKENNYGKPTAHPFNQDNAKNIEKNMKYSDEMNKEETNQIVDEKESIFDDQDSENMEIKENTEVKSCEDKNANFPITVEPNHLSDNSPEICNGKEFLQEAHEAPNAVDVKKNDTEKEIVAENADIINDGDHKIMELDKSNGNEDTSFDEDLDEELFDILEPVPENDQDDSNVPDKNAEISIDCEDIIENTKYVDNKEEINPKKNIENILDDDNMRNKENYESSVVVTETPPCAESIASTSKQRITKDKIGRKNTLSKRLNLRKKKIKLEGGIVSPQDNPLMEKLGLENTSLNDNSYQIPVKENKGKSKTKSLGKGKLKEKQHKRQKRKGEDCQKSEIKITKRISKKETCLICLKVFKNVDLLNIHKRKHEKVTPFKCNICQTYYKQSDNLKKHMKMHTSYKCDLCIRYFADENKLTQHIQKRHNNPKRKKVINSKPSYNEIKVENKHEAIEPTEIQQSTSDPKGSSHTTKKRKRLSREVADENKQSKPAKRLNTKVSEIVKKENVTERNEESQEKPQETCQESCDAEKEDSCFTESGQEPEKQKPITCNICKQLFECKNDLYRHKLTHLKKNVTIREEETFSCNVCQQLFDNKNDLYRHKLTHLKKNTVVKEELFSCNTCSKQFDSKDELLKHEFTHLGQNITIKQEDENKTSKNLDSNILELFRCPEASCEFTISHQSLKKGDGVRHLIKIHNIFPSRMIKSGLQWTKIL